jgi:hypothetical protein
MKDSEQANHPLRRQLTAFAHFTTRSLGETNIEGEIVVGYREEGAGWRLWVHDNGHGLPSDHEKPIRSFIRTAACCRARKSGERGDHVYVSQRDQGGRILRRDVAHAQSGARSSDASVGSVN